MTGWTVTTLNCSAGHRWDARVYNKLSQGVVNKNSVKDFQAALQEEVKLATQGARVEDWQLLFSPWREQWVRI